MPSFIILLVTLHLCAGILHPHKPVPVNNYLQSRKFPNFFKPLKNLKQAVVGAIKEVGNAVGNAVGNPIINSHVLFTSFVEADTNEGRVKGTSGKSRTGIRFFRFQGIPYARAPVGTRRFEPPVPHGKWNGVLDATKLKKPCWQVNPGSGQVEGHEDCLVLNVYSRYYHNKKNVPKTDNGLYPVIVFIHGGLFMFGSANFYFPKYFMDEEVVLVTVNYRLNSFGFLNTGDGLVSGNMGLKDQSLALKWVQNNIRYFHGDPKRVTVQGESAGSVCAHLHTLSPMSRGLFSRAVSQSGTALSPWGFIEDPVTQAKEFASSLGCRKNDPQMVVNCLKKLPAKRIAQYHIGYLRAMAEGKSSLFGPTIDSNPKDPFLPEAPIEILKSGRFSPTPFITGVNSGEGLVYLIPILRNESMRSLLNDRWNDLAPLLLEYRGHPQQNLVTSSIKQFYLNNAPISIETAKMSAKMISDRSFFLDSHDVAILQSHFAPVFPYYYTYEGLFSTGSLLFSRFPIPAVPIDITFSLGMGASWVASNLLGIRPQNKLGIAHGDELLLLFNMPFIRKEIGTFDPDFDMSRKLVKLFVSFAKMGFPNYPDWKPVSQTNPKLEDVTLKRLRIDKEFSIIDEPFSTGIEFWKQLNISNL